ncbi:MAG: hypothetical protein NTU53_16660 [Planctomycetota bacterium]|nr:hypothetical protein [Planctomycetota bacterium]
MRGMPLVCTAVCLFYALVVCTIPPLAWAAAEQRPFTAFSAGRGDVIVSRAGEEHLRFGVAAWGPNWAWSGFEGNAAGNQGAAIGTLTAKLGGTGVPLRIGFRASNPDPRKLRLNYELKAEGDTALTLVIVELAPGKGFQGRDVIVDSQGKQTPVRCPFEKRGLGTQVQTVRMTDASGGTTVIHFDPPCEIASDGSARIVLAKDKLAADEVRRLSINVELPGATSWYPTVADIPDEPGLATWYPWQATGDATQGVLGLSDWIEAPAGKHGCIARQADKLIYDGRPIKLWGLNLCYGTCAPEKPLADKRAAFYRKYGINAVRLHKFADNTGWGGIQSKDSCVEYDPPGLDRMDYQVAKFKQAGIYVKLSAHFGSQKLGPADKQYVPYLEEFGAFKGNRIETPHSAIHYSPELQRVQSLQIVNLLKHKNSYTGLTYAEDPAIAFIEIINEQSILFFTSMAPLKASATLRKQVGQRFCQWLRTKYGSHDKLQQAWGGRAFDCFAGDGFKADGEHLDKGNILPLGNPWYWDPIQLNGSQAFRKQRLLDALQFLYILQGEFYDRYVKALREAGYQGEVVSSNWQAGRALSHFANLYTDWGVGTIDRHNYFGSGQANASMLTRAGSGLLSSGMQQVADRPFMFSEWIHVFPNEMGVEGPAIIGAYGMGLGGWDASFMFQNGDSGSFSAKIGRDQWDVTAPQILGVFPAVARQIHRGDVKESTVTAVRNVHVPSLFEGKLSFDDKVTQGYDDKELDSSKVSARSLAVARSVVAFTREYTETPVFDIKRYEKDGQLVSATGELRWKEGTGTSGGFFTMDTPGTKAVVGSAQGQKCALGAVSIEPTSRFGAIYVTARERDKTIESSKELLIVAVARARNTGMKFSPAGDRMLAAGAGPILMEPVIAKITIRKAGAPKVLVLDHDGRITDRAVPVENGGFIIDGANDRTPYWVVRY